MIIPAAALFFFGFLIAASVYFSTKQLLNTRSIVKPNYSGRAIPTLGGVVVLISLLLSAAILYVAPHLDPTHIESMDYLFIALGFGLIGLLDDLVGDKTSQGFKGHVGALLKGRVTTGSIKLFGGPIIALIVFAGQIPSRGYVPVIVDVLAISLIANLFNLFDLAPGRCSKFVVITFAISCVLMHSATFAYCILGIVVVVLVLDLREAFMLGDVGANMLGALAGLSLVMVSSDCVTIGIVFFALLLNILSEFVSFSKVIDSFVPLRLFDELGQTKSRRAWKKTK